MIRVKLREAIEAYRRRTGIRLTYTRISKLTGISVDTLQSLATRPSYNTRLSTIEKLCRALRCQPGDLLQFASEEKGPLQED